MNEDLEKFKKFDSITDGIDLLPDCPGNYLIALRRGAALPCQIQPDHIPEVSLDGTEYKIIYTGISTKSLRKRDYKQHFTGNNAGRSTLRKSLGSLMELKKIPRDANNPGNGKTKFSEEDEIQLSAWMASNLLLFFMPSSSPRDLEKELIKKLNPPLNILDNPNVVNAGYRIELKNLRSQK